MKRFAKMFESENYGQIVVIQQSADDTGNPEIRFFASPDGLGVCSAALSYNESDTAWDSCNTTFEKVDIAFAEGVVKPIFDMVAEHAQVVLDD